MLKKTTTPKLARLIRFVEPGVLPAGIAAQYIAATNLVRIDKELYDTLNLYEQSELMFTKEDITFNVPDIHHS